LDPNIKKILDKYSDKLKKDIEQFEKGGIKTREYEIFTKEFAGKELSLYEKLVKNFSWFRFIKPKEKDEEKLNESIRVTKLQITSNEVVGFSTTILLIFVFLAIVIGFLTQFIFHKFNLFLVLVLFILGLSLFLFFSNYPNSLATRWRLKASNQMVMCILYVVMYMRHTSNLENAIRFAANHLGYPLGYDLRKVYWDVETGTFNSVKDSLGHYLNQWKDWNPEFLESFHLIEGSLYEVDEIKRIALLDKALQVMLDSTYDNMMHYAHALNSPITILHMLGIILPILGLIIFPLIGAFLGGLIKWYHLFFLYNLILPILVYLYGNSLLVKRPSGYGETNILEDSNELQQLRNEKINFLGFNFSYLSLALIVALPMLLLALFPLYSNWFFGEKFNEFNGYFCEGVSCYGPFSNTALILSLFLPLSIAFGLGVYYYFKTKKAILIRDETKRLEKEFSSALFQLGNRVGDGLPLELAFGRVAESITGSVTGKFFSMVDSNIKRLGMSVESAIFDKKKGAINYFPSNIIESSMMIAIEGARKGPQVVAKTMNSISMYILSIRKVEERLKDLLADILSSMQSQIVFLAPLIAGIVVGISSMMTNVLLKLGETLSKQAGSAEGVNFMGLSPNVIGLFKLDSVISPYFFQAVIGIYVVQIIIILTILSVRIKNGEDTLSVENELGKNLIRSTMLYFIVSLIGILIFKTLAGTIIAGGF